MTIGFHVKMGGPAVVAVAAKKKRTIDVLCIRFCCVGCLKNEASLELANVYVYTKEESDSLSLFPSPTDLSWLVFRLSMRLIILIT